MRGALLKNNEEVLFIDKERNRFRRHSGGKSKSDVDKFRG